MSQEGEIWILACVQAGVAVLGLVGAAGVFDFALGPHRRDAYPPELWRRANRTVGFGLTTAGLVGFGLSLAAIASEPDRRTLAAVGAGWTGVVAVVGTLAGLRTLTRYRRSGARWR